MTIADIAAEKLRLLPEEKQREVLALVEKLAAQAPAAGPRVDPRGSLAGKLPDLSLEDFLENRREMWGTGTDRELDHR